MVYVVLLVLGFLGYCMWEVNYNRKVDEMVARAKEMDKENRAIERKNMKMGDFCIDKFWEDKAVIDQIEKKMGKNGYFDGYLIETILNVEKAGVESLLAQCEEAVEYYSSGEEVTMFYCEDATPAQAAKFFRECVELCKKQLKSFEKGDKKNDKTA